MTAGRRWSIALVVGLPAVALLLFFVLPVAGMVHRGLWPDGHFAPRGVLAELTAPRTGVVVWFTAWTAGLAATVSIVLGLPLAFVLYRLRFPGRDLLRALTMIPFVLPTVVVGVAFTQLFAVGPLARLDAEGSAGAIVAAMVFMNVGLMARIVGTYWSTLDRRREQAAAALGATPLQVLRTITVPALLPAVAAAASVVFLFCATSFGIVLTLGGFRYSNVETEIYLLTTQELDLSAAAALSLLQLVLIVALLLVVGRVRRDAADRIAAPARRVGRRDLPVLAVSAIVLVGLAYPLTVLLVASLRRNGSWSWANFGDLASTGGNVLLVPATTALITSLVIAVKASVLAVTLGGCVAYVVSRRPRGRWSRRMVNLFDGAFMLPLGVSAVTVGFGFLITLDRPPLDLRTSSVLIPIAQAMVALPLVVRTVAPVWRSVEDRQRQAAATLGAGPWRTFLTVDLPAGWRALLVATGFALAVSLGEFGATSFLARSDDPTLPVVIYRLLGHPGVTNFGMAMAASALLAVTTAGLALAVEGLGGRRIGAL